jgi:hypothetical protein
MARSALPNRALGALRPEPQASRPFGDDPSREAYCTPRRGQSVPRPAKRRRYADAPAAALLTGLVVPRPVDHSTLVGARIEQQHYPERTGIHRGLERYCRQVRAS